MNCTGVYVTVVCVAGLSACGGAVGDSYHCRVTRVYDELSGDTFKLGDSEFVFTVEDETDIYVAGKASSLGKNRNGDAPYVVVSKLDGKFDGMQVQLGDRSTYYEGFCKPRP